MSVDAQISTHVIGVPFTKGSSGNPGGRPKGLGALIRSRTKDGKELVDKMLEILRGEMTIEKTYYDTDGEAHSTFDEPSHKDRIEAVKWLADRGFGKAVETSINLNADADLEIISTLLAKQMLENAKAIDA